MSYQDWRKEARLVCTTSYKKRFAFWPVSCVDFENKIWLKSYYIKYNTWSTSYQSEYGHVDLAECISEEEYIVRKIAGKL